MEPARHGRASVRGRPPVRMDVPARDDPVHGPSVRVGYPLVHHPPAAAGGPRDVLVPEDRGSLAPGGDRRWADAGPGHRLLAAGPDAAVRGIAGVDSDPSRLRFPAAAGSNLAGAHRMGRTRIRRLGPGCGRAHEPRSGHRHGGTRFLRHRQVALGDPGRPERPGTAGGGGTPRRSHAAGEPGFLPSPVRVPSPNDAGPRLRRTRGPRRPAGRTPSLTGAARSGGFASLAPGLCHISRRVPRYDDAGAVVRSVEARAATAPRRGVRRVCGSLLRPLAPGRRFIRRRQPVLGSSLRRLPARAGATSIRGDSGAAPPRRCGSRRLARSPTTSGGSASFRVDGLGAASASRRRGPHPFGAPGGRCRCQRGRPRCRAHPARLHRSRSGPSRRGALGERIDRPDVQRRRGSVTGPSTHPERSVHAARPAQVQCFRLPGPRPDRPAAEGRGRSIHQPRSEPRHRQGVSRTPGPRELGSPGQPAGHAVRVGRRPGIQPGAAARLLEIRAIGGAEADQVQRGGLPGVVSRCPGPPGRGLDRGAGGRPTGSGGDRGRHRRPLVPVPHRDRDTAGIGAHAMDGGPRRRRRPGRGHRPGVRTFSAGRAGEGSGPLPERGGNDGGFVRTHRAGPGPRCRRRARRGDAARAQHLRSQLAGSPRRPARPDPASQFVPSGRGPPGRPARDRARARRPVGRPRLAGIRIGHRRPGPRRSLPAPRPARGSASTAKGSEGRLRPPWRHR